MGDGLLDLNVLKSPKVTLDASVFLQSPPEEVVSRKLCILSFKVCMVKKHDTSYSHTDRYTEN